MSSTGVRETNSNEKRIIKGLILNEEQFIQSLRVFANTSTLSGLGATGTETNNSPVDASGNYLAKSGDIMIGQLGNAFDTLAATNIVGDILDVSKATGTTFPVVVLQGESPPDPDDLVTITEGVDVFPFQELVIRTRSSVITIKNSDNINTPDGNDLVLPIGSIIHLYFDTFLGEWVIDGGTPFFGSGGGNVPDPTAEFQHLQSDGANNWIAQQTLEFGVNSATSAQLNIPNDVIGLAWRNATNDGNLEFKGTIAGNLDLTRDDETAISFTVRSQHAIELDQSFSVTVGSGSVTGADVVIAASTAIMKFEVGGAQRLEIDATTQTTMTLAALAGGAIADFNVISTDAVDPDNVFTMTIGSGAGAEAQLETSAHIGKLFLITGGVARWQLDGTTGTDVLQTALSINPLYEFFRDDTTNDNDIIGTINFSADNSSANKIVFASIFVEANDVTAATEDSTIFLQTISNGFLSSRLRLLGGGIQVVDGSVRFDEITLPSNPIAGTGLIYVRDEAGTTTPFFLDSSGTETSLIGAGSQTPWLSTIDADGNLLENLGLTVYQTSTLGASTEPFSVYDGANLRWHVPGTDGFVWTIGAFDQILGLGPSVVNVFKVLDMQNANKIINVNDPTADQDVVTRKFLEDNPSIPGGVQDARIWIDHETAEFDFEVWHTNNKNGDLGSSVPLADDTAFYIPIWVGDNVTLREIGIDVTVAGAATVTLALYDSEDAQNYPRTRIDFSISVNGISLGTGIRTLTFFEALAPGLYFLLVRTDTGISIRQWNPDAAVSVGHFPASGVTGAMAPISGYFDDLTSSTPDATADNDMSVLNGNSQVGIPAIYARFD